MIKNVVSGSGIAVTVIGNTGSPCIGGSGPSAGMLRDHMNNIEVYDEMSWRPLSSGTKLVSLDNPTQEAIDWVRRKMQQEKELVALAKLHPTVADAVQARDHAEDTLKIAVALCKIVK